MAPARGATILHADLDAFYASVEQLLDPTLRGRPVAVGGGVILAASYEAKAYGVGSGMSGWQARRLCPRLVFVEGHFNRYRELAEVVMEVFAEFTPLVERVSIDEAFLDIEGSLHLFGPPGIVAKAIRRRVRQETGLAVSVGAADTKHLAKVASQVAKPDGLVVVQPAQARQFLAPLPVALVWGVGERTRQRLAEAGIRTIGQLADTPPDVLGALLGQAAGARLHALAHDVDPRQVTARGPATSVGAQSALGRQTPTPELLARVLGHLADRVAGRLRAGAVGARTVTVRVRFPSVRSVTRSRTLRHPEQSTRALAETALELAGATLKANAMEEITLLGLSASHLVPTRALQLELALGDQGGEQGPGSPQGAARLAAERAADAVRRRFGRSAVAYAGAALGEADGVPEEFRALAERALGPQGADPLPRGAQSPRPAPLGAPRSRRREVSGTRPRSAP